MLAVISEDEDLSRTSAAEGIELTTKIAVEVGKKLAKGLRSTVTVITPEYLTGFSTRYNWKHVRVHAWCSGPNQWNNRRVIQVSICNIAGIAFVGYKDWSDDIDHFEIFPFSREVSRFSRFVSVIEPKGGGDYAEDVLGGLNTVRNSLE